MAYREIELYDIKHRKPVVYADLCENANSLSRDLYVCVEGNSMELPEWTKVALLNLAKNIENYFAKPIDK